MLAKLYKSLMMMNGQILLKDYTGEKAVLEFSDSETHLVSDLLPRIQGPSNPDGLFISKTAFRGQPQRSTRCVMYFHASMLQYISISICLKNS